MDRSQQLARSLGVPLGAKGDRLQPVVGALTAQGVAVHNKSISRLRMGDTSGVKILAHVRGAALLQADNAAPKDGFYLAVAEAGLRVRQPRRGRHQPDRYSSDGYTEAIAADLGLDAQPVRRCLRAMRADVLASVRSEPRDELAATLRIQAEAFLAARLGGPPSLRSPLARRLDEEWDHRSIPSFYRALYAGPAGRRAQGTWTPYEVEVLQTFYVARAATGHPLTPLHRAVLDAYLAHQPLAKLADPWNAAIAVGLDVPVLENHRNAPLYGRPTPPDDV